MSWSLLSASKRLWYTVAVSIIALSLLAGGCGSSGGTFQQIGDTPELREHFKGSKPVVASFYLPMCPACGMTSFALTRLSNEYADRVDFVKLNGYDAIHARSAYDVTMFPTVVLFQKGRETHRWINESSIGDYRVILDAALAAPLK